MRYLVLSLAATVTLLFSTTSAQVMQFRTPAPEVTAATAAWQVNNDPIVVSGLQYIATREFRMFDGQVMAQIDVYQRIPIYADTTLEPFTIVYVPVTRDRMRAYERAPIDTIHIASGRGTTLISTATSIAPARTAPAAVEEEAPTVGTTGTTVSTRREDVSPRSRGRRTTVESIPGPHGPNGVWVEFNGARWYSAGPATSYTRGRFTLVGSYHGFPVYRDNSSSDKIWIASVNGGPLAPYRRQ